MTGGSTARIYREVLRDRRLLRVQIAFLAFTAAEYAVWIAVTIYAYDHGRATAAGLVLLAQLLPAAIFAPIAATSGDRMSRVRALRLGYAAQSAAYLLLGLGLWLAPPLAAYAAAIVSSVAVTLTRPVHYAIVPELAHTPAQLTAANSVSSSVEGIGILVGPLATSFLVLVFGVASVPLVFSAVMGTVASLFVTIRSERDVAVDRSGHAAGILLETIGAARTLAHDAPAAVLTLLGGAQYVVIGLLDVFYAVLAIDLLGEGEHVAGFLASAVGLGGLVGAGVTVLLVGRRRLSLPIVVSLGGTGLALAAIAWAPSLVPASVLLAAAGASRTFFDVASRTLLQRSLDRDLIARVFGLQEGLIMLGLAVGSVLAPVLVGLFGAEGALIAMGVLVPVSGLVSLGALRRLDRRSVLVDDAVRSLLEAISIFEPLPPFELEDVGRLLIPVAAVAGEILVREGDPGDRFYMVSAGTVVVQTAGREVARIDRGGYFGEIALLRDVPRTATVVALTDVSLLALEREDFLSAVSGGRRIGSSAQTEIDRRLGELGRIDPGSG